MWAAPNEPEGPGGISDGRSAHDTDVRAPQKLEAAEMRGFEATVGIYIGCLNDCISRNSALHIECRRCIKPCLGI